MRAYTVTVWVTVGMNYYARFCPERCYTVLHSKSGVVHCNVAELSGALCCGEGGASTLGGAASLGVLASCTVLH